jgi:UDP-glucose 4-epimerase
VSRRVAVTGAAGLIASAVVRQLAARGDEVLALDLGGHDQLVPGTSIPLTAVDVAEPQLWQSLDEFAPDAVVHAAAHPGGKSLAEPSDDVRTNALGSMRVFEWCARERRPVVYLSSSIVYGDQPPGPIAETAPVSPGTVYGVAKLACEGWLRVLGEGRGLRWTVLRLFATYGAGHKPSLQQGIVNIMLTQLLRGDRVVVRGSLERRRDLVYVDDAAGAIVAAIDSDAARGHVINVGTGVEVTIGGMITSLARALGRDPGALTIVEEPGTVGDPLSNLADISRMRTVLEYEPRFTLDAGLGAMVSRLPSVS